MVNIFWMALVGFVAFCIMLFGLNIWNIPCVPGLIINFLPSLKKKEPNGDLTQDLKGIIGN